MTDLPLAEDAATVATRLRVGLPAEVPVYTSPLLRCRRLAEMLDANPMVDPRLREVDFGAWEMHTWDAIGREALDAWAVDPLGYAGHGGEAAAQARARVAGFLADLRAANPAAAVAVTHAGVMKLACAELLGLPQDDWLAMRFAFGEAVAFDIDGSTARRVF